MQLPHTPRLKNPFVSRLLSHSPGRQDCLEVTDPLVRPRTSCMTSQPNLVDELLFPTTREGVDQGLR
jgi:hypothetical protein